MEQLILVCFIGLIALIAMGQSAHHHGSHRRVILYAPPTRAAHAGQARVDNSPAAGSSDTVEEGRGIRD
jgi:hypothetical protein